MTIAFKIVLGLILVPAATLGLSSFLIDPNAFKEDLSKQIAAATGLSVSIEGDLKFSLFPAIELEINDASVASAPGFGDEPFAQLGQARIWAKWSALLGGRLEIDRVTLSGLMLNLIRNIQGRGNWERPTEVVSASLPSPTDSTNPRFYPVVYTENAAGETDRSSFDGVSINAIEIAGSRVSWTDHLFGSQIILSELDGASGRIAAETPIGLKLTGNAADIGSGWSTRLALNALVTTDTQARYLTLSPIKLQLTELTTKQGFAGNAVLTSTIEADLTANRWLTKGLSLRFTVGGAAVWNASIPANLIADLTLDLFNQTMQVDGLSASSGALQLHGNLTAQQLFDAPIADGHFAVPEFDLQTWLSQQGLPTPRIADPAALTKVALETDWQMEDGQLDLRAMNLTLDQTQFTGWTTLLPTSPVGYRFNIEADALDLDRYLPHPPLAESAKTSAIYRQTQQAVFIPVRYDPAAASTVAAAAIPAAPTGAEEQATRSLSPDELVQRLDLDGELSFGELRLANLVLGNANLHISANGGRVSVKNSVERFYDGRIDGQMGLTSQAGSPILSIDQRATGIQTGPMLRDLVGDDALTGSGEITARVNATGQDLDAIKRSLNGALRVDLTDGAIKGFDIQQMIREAEARLTGGPAPPWRPAQTEFTTLTASAVIRDGILHNDDLSGTSEYLHVGGHGRIDIANERLDYWLAPRLVNPPEGRGIKEIEDIPIPVHLTGSFRNPKWDVELGPILRDMANRGLGQDLEEKAGKVIRKLEESTGVKGLEQGLRRLFGF